MLDENKKEESNADLQWEAMSELLPERPVDMPEDDGLGIDNSTGDGLKSSKRFTPKLTDAQTFDLRLFPKQEYNWLEMLQVSRTFPDSYNPAFRIYVKTLLKLNRKKMSMGEAIANVATPLSISIDGEGRIDELALANGAGMQQANEDKSKGII